VVVLVVALATDVCTPKYEQKYFFSFYKIMVVRHGRRGRGGYLKF